MEWDPDHYLKFANERTQPAVDLARRIEADPVNKAVDIGCGPGNSTAVLAARFPGARVIGVDSSPEMLETARNAHPGPEYALCDAAKDLPTLGGGFDVAFSNACLQWVPDHERVISDVSGLLRKGGVFAAQIPYNAGEPIRTLIDGAASSPRWKDRLGAVRPFYTRTPNAYYDILIRRFEEVRIWETAYYHALEGPGAILEWYGATGLKPYLERLAGAERSVFEAEILEGVERSYPRQADGRVLFRFPRLFFIARK